MRHIKLCLLLLVIWSSPLFSYNEADRARLLSGEKDLRNTDLSKTRFTGNNFSGVDFRGANFSKTSFFGCDLQGCQFQGASVTETRFLPLTAYVSRPGFDANLLIKYTNINNAHFDDEQPLCLNLHFVEYDAIYIGDSIVMSTVHPVLFHSPMIRLFTIEDIHHCPLCHSDTLHLLSCAHLFCKICSKKNYVFTSQERCTICRRAAGIAALEMSHK